MTKTVWKFSVEAFKNINPVLEIPGGGTFLTLKDKTHESDGQELQPGLGIVETWWAVDTDNPPVEVQLYIRGTGDVVPPSSSYLGTFYPRPYLTLHVWKHERQFEDMRIVDGRFVPKSQ